MINLKKVGQNISKIRKKRNISIKKMASYLKINENDVSKIEKGEYTIDSDLIERISILLACPLKTLLFDYMNENAISFRAEKIRSNDLEKLARINKIALYQFEMDSIDYDK